MIAAPVLLVDERPVGARNPVAAGHADLRYSLMSPPQGVVRTIGWHRCRSTPTTELLAPTGTPTNRIVPTIFYIIIITSLQDTRGCPKPCRGWSCRSSVFVDESAAGCRSDNRLASLQVNAHDRVVGTHRDPHEPRGLRETVPLAIHAARSLGTGRV